MLPLLVLLLNREKTVAKEGRVIFVHFVFACNESGTPQFDQNIPLHICNYIWQMKFNGHIYKKGYVSFFFLKELKAAKTVASSLVSP